jgi:hypothetical protein
MPPPPMQPLNLGFDEENILRMALPVLDLGFDDMPVP